MTVTAAPAPTTTDALALPTSAHREAPHTRALRLGLLRHGPTPTYDRLVDALGIDPAHAA